MATVHLQKVNICPRFVTLYGGGRNHDSCARGFVGSGPGQLCNFLRTFGMETCVLPGVIKLFPIMRGLRTVRQLFAYAAMLK